MSGGGKRLPNSSYAPNGAFVTDSNAIIADVGTVITYIIRNDGTTPPFVGGFGFGQAQINEEASSIIENIVTIRPGPGSTRVLSSFQFKSVSNEQLEIYQPVTGDGPLNENGWLIPNGIEDVTIQFVGRTAPDEPPTWFIRIGPSWYSTSTTVGTARVTVTMQLASEINSVVTAGKAVQANATTYSYSKK